MSFTAVGGDEVHHEGATVAGRNKVQDRGDDGHERQEGAHAVVLIHDVEPVSGGIATGKHANRAHIRSGVVCFVGITRQGRRHVKAWPSVGGTEHWGCVLEVRRVVVQRSAEVLQPVRTAVHSDGRGTKDAEPKHGIHEGQGESVNHNLLDGTSTGDAGHESANERGPSDPPAPVENGPPVHPRRVCSLPVIGPAVAQVQLRKCVGIEGNLQEVVQVVANGLHDNVEDVP
mmetsp:Transcript_63208/g.148440  ORF Transcript_63208/g.148440 Transcript_63208/m.148440 type:complete len:230 (-) Transcript_63208:970-1659(-)